MNNVNVIKEVGKELGYEGKPLVYTVEMANMLGGVGKAVLLNQMLYWSDRATKKDGSFYKEFGDWEKELGIKERTLQNYMKDFREKGFVTIKHKMANGKRTNHYFLNIENITNYMRDFNGTKNLRSPKRKNCVPNRDEKIALPITESTTENTTENTSSKQESVQEEEREEKKRVNVRSETSNISTKVYNNKEHINNNATNLGNGDIKDMTNQKQENRTDDIEYINSIIDYYNQTTGQSRKKNKTNQDLVRKRIKDGYTLEQFKKAIEACTTMWKDNAKMDKYLRPFTVFNGKMGEREDQAEKNKKRNEWLGDGENEKIDCSTTEEFGDLLDNLILDIER